ncbi:hypothetical protein [Streptomyces sp. NPDC058683]|uniref:hypothetical protein n=1 Tax=Streptomyces sp. NPDC058683 TaxID=3346597 RepID=UPI0036539391
MPWKAVVKVGELRQRDATEPVQLRIDVDHLVRAVNQLIVENRQLRGALSQPGAGAIGALPPRPHPDRIP